MVGEHGFIGLGLFCALIAATYRSCAVVQKRVRGRDELAWTADLARATQIGLVAFVVGGSFVSIASNPFLYMLAGIAVGTRSLVERELAITSGLGPATRISAKTPSSWNVPAIAGSGNVLNRFL